MSLADNFSELSGQLLELVEYGFERLGMGPPPPALSFSLEGDSRERASHECAALPFSIFRLQSNDVVAFATANDSLESMYQSRVLSGLISSVIILANLPHMTKRLFAKLRPK
ncbi:hypothetical protein THAOC_15170 [Thalassiosira oceanica]|uniref:Uncharacterized protein n=1 Tax=Thalassiosira oceanica TaxID=159749 RepID=K0ST10_THAOC|nr:hypothetical protein THAOC_15170 [Thalassiosira oceanica]|mmetsp:Transcript_25781/g.57820  ORF Transcript_25781/g.57820 Transcript_25781/m.57820 type:complete len:112 (+) Transcript_25781:433-768(+)|eukprot:EJK64126.1 hypothetical protein THAOC_15170 [Thalassiosira oceanica]